MRPQKTYGAAIEHAPLVFRAELGRWVKFGRVPDNELLAAIIRNDLQATIAFTGDWALVRATLRWLWAFAPSGCFGSADAAGQWRGGGDILMWRMDA